MFITERFRVQALDKGRFDPLHLLHSCPFPFKSLLKSRKQFVIGHLHRIDFAHKWMKYLRVRIILLLAESKTYLHTQKPKIGSIVAGSLS